MKSGYVVRPRAIQDLEEHSYYLAREANPDTGHNFLVAAHKMFALFAAHPEMGWRFQLKYSSLTSLRVFRISGFEKMLVLYIPAESQVEIVRVIHGSRNLPALLRG